MVGAQVIIVENTVVVLINKQALDGAACLVIDLFKHVEHVCRITHIVNHVLEGTVITGRAKTTEVSRCTAVGQLKDLVGVVSEVSADLPSEVLGLYRNGVDGKLDTSIAQATDVVNYKLCEVCTSGNLGFSIDQVGSLAVVPVNATIDAVI